ncbi:MAG: hypothetical protein V7L14_10275 [Nostoc sp.]|uniref:hypothetical protein n=1 Tax=Nostoc sp. TaxID=1180 RepID=UPI002FF9C5F9
MFRSAQHDNLSIYARGLLKEYLDSKLPVLFPVDNHLLQELLELFETQILVVEPVPLNAKLNYAFKKANKD